MDCGNVEPIKAIVGQRGGSTLVPLESDRNKRHRYAHVKTLNMRVGDRGGGGESGRDGC